MHKASGKLLSDKKIGGLAFTKIRKTLLVPIATVGCGKTTLGLALAKLFSFGHIQNDDITGGKIRKKFHKRINEEFESRDVVIADRNNHVKDLRRSLIEAVENHISDVLIVAIYWNHDNRTSSEIFKITYERLIARGENHQTLNVLNTNKRECVWTFLNDFERLDLNNEVDSRFNHVINLDIANDVKANLGIVINELRSIIGIKKPSNNAINNALEEIKHYRVVTRKPHVSYYGIDLDFNVQDFLTKYYKEHPNKDSETFNILVQEDRIDSTHHITLIHAKQSKSYPSVWEKYERLCEDFTQHVRVYINKIVFNSQIMALVVNRIDPPTIYSMNRVAHVTVGTVNGVKPFQSNTICELVVSGNHGNVRPKIRVINLEQELVIEGTVKAFF